MTIRVIQTTAASGARTLDWVPLNPAVDDGPFNVQISYNRTGAGTGSGRIDYTLENVMEAGVSAFAITERTVEDATAFNMTHPAYAVRLAVTSASGNNQV